MSHNAFEQEIKSRISFHTDYYEEIKLFYNFVLDKYEKSEYDFIVLTTRRSYVLFKIFERIRGAAVKSKTAIVNNHSLDFFDSDFWKDKSVLIVDDILINGRAVRAIIEKISHAQKKVFVFARNKEARCLTDEITECLLNNTYHIGVVSEEKWRDYSSMLNELVLVSGMGYVSFVNTFRTTTKKSAKLIDKLCNLFSPYSLTNDIYNEKNIEAKVFFFNTSVLEQKDDFLYTRWFVKQLTYLGIKPCLRKYTFSNSGFSGEVLIPYTFLPDVTAKQLETICNILLSVLPLKSIRLGEDSINNVISNESLDLAYITNKTYNNYRALYLLLTNLCSSFLMEVIQKDCLALDTNADIVKNLDVDKELLISISYDEKFVLHDVWELNNQKFENEYFYSVQDNIENEKCLEQLTFALQGISENMLKDQEDFYSRISDYLYRMRTIDQRNAEHMARRANGIRVSDIVSVLNKMIPQLDVSKYLDSIYAVMIRCWDSGRGSFVIREFSAKTDNNVYICSSLINGEQIFIFPFARDYDISYQFCCFSNIAHTTVPRNLLAFARFMDKRYQTDMYEKSLKAYFSGNENDYQNGIGNYSIRRSANRDISDVLDYVMNHYGQGARM